MITISPVGLSAASVNDVLPILVTIQEKLCKFICVNSLNQPKVTITYTYDTPTLNGTTVFIPITATIVIVYPGCGSKTQMIREKFTVAFQGQTAIPTSVVITSEGINQTYTKQICGKCNTIVLDNSITVAITA